MYSPLFHKLTALDRARRCKRSTALLLGLAVFAAASSALASSLTLIPIPSAWATNNQTTGLNATNKGGVLHQSEARAITPDGKYVVGLYYDWTNLITSYGGSDPHMQYLKGCVDQAAGFFYNVPDNTVGRPLCGSYAVAVTGVAYRTNNTGGIETIADGFGGGWKSEYMTTTGGTNFTGKVRDLFINFTSSGGPIIPLANTMGATTHSDVYYSIIGGFQPFENSLEYAYVYRGSNSWSVNNFTTNNSHYFQTYRGDNTTVPVNTGNMVRMNGVAATGRQVGWYVDGGLEWLGSPYEGYYGTSGGILSFVVEYPPPPMGGSGSLPYNEMWNVWPFAGLDGTWLGSAWAITPDGNTIFGHSPIYSGSAWYGYKAIVTSETNSLQSIARLPDFPDAEGAPVAGASWAVIPFGCSTDGRYAVGVCYRGAVKGERAVLWDTGNADTNNWTSLDLTDYATSEGIMGSFTSLQRAYSVGVNAAGNPVVTGYGKYNDGTALRNRAFVLVVTPAVVTQTRPKITSITGAGTSSVTVNYTNTVAGKLYNLEYCTNLSGTPTWNPAGSKVAAGTSDSQINTPAGSAPRFYRVYYTP